MFKGFSFYNVGMVFWLLSLVLVFVGILILPGLAVQSVAVIMTSIANFILGGLAIIYAEFMKTEK